MNIWLIVFILVALFLAFNYKNYTEGFTCAYRLEDEMLIEEEERLKRKWIDEHECPAGWQRNKDKGVVYNSGIPPAIKWLPRGLDNYPPPSLPPQGKPQPSVWKWKPYLNYYYYDPWWSYSYPYNRICDAFARRNCSGSWYPRTCFREQYNKCVTEKIF